MDRNATLVVIGHDNLACSYERLGKELDPAEITERAGGLACLVGAARAYGNFATSRAAARRLLVHGIDPIQVPTKVNGQHVRNPTDIVLSLDILEAAIRRRDVKKIVLCGGDGDFVPALARARRYGKRIGVVAVEHSLATDLAALAGEDLQLIGGDQRALAAA